MTLHAAKGLEFERVWLVGCEEGLLPHRNSVDKPAELEEERRLLYVGITRARQYLSLSHAKTRTIHGESLPQAPSRFLKDLPDSVQHVSSQAPATAPGASTSDVLTVDHWNGASDIGDVFTHPHFGPGIVIQLSDNLVTCVFEDHGVKTFAVDIASS